jgi:hypothetical protein
MNKDSINWVGILFRILAALILVYATYNPEGYSFYHWALAPIFKVPVTSFGAINPLKVLAGIALLGGWLVFLQATRRSLGRKGALLTLALFASVVWLLIYWDVISPRGARAIGHIILIVVALVLATGMSWSHFTRRMAGQVDTDEVG